MRIGFDVDGVLANFTLAFTKILHDVNPGCPITEDQGKVLGWNYEEFLPVTKEDIRNAWKIIDGTTDFWISLKPLINLNPVVDFVNKNRIKHDFYFITQRGGTGGKTAVYQTVSWLQAQGFINPLVIETSIKGDAVKLLGIDYYIDDRDKNCWDVVVKNAECQVYCPDYPYNKNTSYPIKKVDSVIDYINQIILDLE